jgi:glutamate decarboxylase
MIKDDLTLDGTPTLNLASFVTTYMVSGSTPNLVLAWWKTQTNHKNSPTHVEEPY